MKEEPSLNGVTRDGLLLAFPSLPCDSMNLPPVPFLNNLGKGREGRRYTTLCIHMLTAFRVVKRNTIAMIMLAMTFGTTPETKRICRKPSTTISSFIPGIDGLQVVSVNTQHTNRIAGPATATGDRERE